MKGKFNIKRMWLLMKAVVTDNRKAIIHKFATITVIIGIIPFVAFFSELQRIANIEDVSIFQVDRAVTEGIIIPSDYDGPLYPLIFILTAGVGYIAYSLFKNSLKKDNQLQRYMIPASLIEKFTTNVILALSTAPILILISDVILSVVLSTIFKLAYGVDISSGTYNLSQSDSLSTSIILCVLVPLYVVAFFIIIPILNTDVKSRIDRTVHIFIVALGFGIPALLIYLLSMDYDTGLSISFAVITIVAWWLSYYIFKNKELKR